MGGWNNSSLGMYVDDGLLFACAEEWADVTTLLRAQYSVCEEWLRRSGLAIEPDKTELLFFQKPYASGKRIFCFFVLFVLFLLATSKKST